MSPFKRDVKLLRTKCLKIRVWVFLHSFIGTVLSISVHYDSFCVSPFKRYVRDTRITGYRSDDGCEKKIKPIKAEKRAAHVYNWYLKT